MCGASDDPTMHDVPARLEYLRGEIEAERISYGELSELASLAGYIDPSDVVLLQWAGVPEDDEVRRLYLEHATTDAHTGDTYVDGCPTCYPGYPHDYGQHCGCADCGGTDGTDRR